MKNLHITLILLLLCFTTNSIAQDATNDATWEETIGFLTDFLPNFNHTLIEGKFIEHQKYNLHGLLLTKKSEGKYCNYTYVANLNELDKVVLVDDIVLNITSELKLIFTGKIVKREVVCSKLPQVAYIYYLKINLLAERDSNNNSYKYFAEPSSQNTQRLLKAFQHLAYLAKEKRAKNKF
jgi:hypothetical protein